MPLANDKTCARCGHELKWTGSFRDGHMDCENLLCLDYHSHGRVTQAVEVVTQEAEVVYLNGASEDLTKALKEYYGIKDDGLGDVEDGS